MKPTVILSDDYFLKYKDKPVKIRPFDIESRMVGERMIEKIKSKLNSDVLVELRGSTAYEISGKGDVEIGIYPDRSEVDEVKLKLVQEFGEPEVIEPEYMKFDSKDGGWNVEIMIMTGYVAEMDKKLRRYLMSHPDLLAEYEKVKVKYASSRRDYNREKHRFLRRVEEMIPE